MEATLKSWLNKYPSPATMSHLINQVCWFFPNNNNCCFNSYIFGIIKAGSDLIRKLLMPNPRDRATIIDICTDEWVNQDFEHSLLQVAEDLSNLTPVRCDMLLALAPTSPKVESNDNKETKEEVAGEEAVLSNNPEENEIQESNKIAESNKRTVDNTSFSASLSKVDENKNSKKKTKRAETESATLPKEETNDSPQNEVPAITESQTLISRDQSEGSTADASSQPATSETTSSPKTVEPTNSGTFKRPGRLSIPKIWDSQENVISSPEDAGKERKAPFIPVGLKVSEAKKVIERRCSVDSGSPMALKRRDSMSSANGNKVRELKKYTGRSLSLNLQETSKTKRESVNQTVHKNDVAPSSASRTKKEGSESPYQSKPSTPISEEDKSLAKQIIKKNIARAKLMEKQQVSVSSDTDTPTTPLVSIENSNVSIIEKTPKEAVSKTNAHGDLIQIASEGAFNPSPITRSYKKVTFTKDGACIKESGKFYTHEGKDGYTTRVEKKSMVTHIINDGGNGNNVNIQRSDSGSSTDIFDDIFDDHWTGDVFSNVKSLFNNIFERKSIRKSAFDDDNLSTGSSNWTSMSKFSSSFKSNFDKRFNDLMSPLSTRREQSKITYPSFSKFGSRFSRESSLHRDSDSLRESGSLGAAANEPNREDSTRKRVEQWLNSDGKELETYGTIGPKNFRRYMRTMTSNDSASNIFKRVQVSNASELGQVLMEKSAATVENCESFNSNAVPRDNEIEVRFSLDNLEAGGPKVLTKKGPVRVSSEQSEVSTADSGIKIAETSSLLEQLRTFGYKNLVSRRLSESSSTEDIQSACQESSSDANFESSGK